MRYTTETRITNPSAEYVKLWAVLDELGIDYIKMGKINSTNDNRENWAIPAVISLPSNCMYARGGIEFKENYYLNGYGYSKKSKEVKQRLLNYCGNSNIPVILISRRKTQDEMRIAIQKWIISLRKE